LEAFRKAWQQYQDSLRYIATARDENGNRMAHFAGRGAQASMDEKDTLSVERLKLLRVDELRKLTEEVLHASEFLKGQREIIDGSRNRRDASFRADDDGGVSVHSPRPPRKFQEHQHRQHQGRGVTSLELTPPPFRGASDGASGGAPSTTPLRGLSYRNNSCYCDSALFVLLQDPRTWFHNFLLTPHSHDLNTLRFFEVVKKLVTYFNAPYDGHEDQGRRQTLSDIRSDTTPQVDILTAEFSMNPRSRYLEGRQEDILEYVSSFVNRTRLPLLQLTTDSSTKEGRGHLQNGAYTEGAVVYVNLPSLRDSIELPEERLHFSTAIAGDYLTRNSGEEDRRGHNGWTRHTTIVNLARPFFILACTRTVSTGNEKDFTPIAIDDEIELSATSEERMGELARLHATRRNDDVRRVVAALHKDHEDGRLGQVKLELRAVAVHRGGNAQRGHYIAYVKRDGQWRFYDDMDDGGNLPVVGTDLASVAQHCEGNNSAYRRRKKTTRQPLQGLGALSQNAVLFVYEGQRDGGKSGGGSSSPSASSSSLLSAA